MWVNVVNNGNNKYRAKKRSTSTTTTTSTNDCRMKQKKRKQPRQRSAKEDTEKKNTRETEWKPVLCANRFTWYTRITKIYFFFLDFGRVQFFFASPWCCCRRCLACNLIDWFLVFGWFFRWTSRSFDCILVFVLGCVSSFFCRWWLPDLVGQPSAALVTLRMSRLSFF